MPAKNTPRLVGTLLISILIRNAVFLADVAIGSLRFLESLSGRLTDVLLRPQRVGTSVSRHERMSRKSTAILHKFLYNAKCVLSVRERPFRIPLQRQELRHIVIVGVRGPTGRGLCWSVSESPSNRLKNDFLPSFSRNRRIVPAGWLPSILSLSLKTWRSKPLSLAKLGGVR